MNINKTIRNYWKENRFELVVTFFIFTNLYTFYFPAFMYYIGIAMILWKKSKMKHDDNSMGGLYWAFIIVASLSSVVNGIVNPRLGVFVLVLYVASPIATSVEWHLWKRKLLNNFFLGYTFVVLSSFVAKFITGVNNQWLRFDYSDGTFALETIEFSGYATFPMWVSAASGLACTYFTYLYFNKAQYAKILYKYGCMALIIASIYIVLISGSRSALTLAVGCMGLLIYWSSKNVSNMSKYAFSIAIVGAMAMPVFMNNTAVINRKQMTQKSIGQTSRDLLWAQRFEEIQSSPILGIGFAVTGTGENKKAGRAETGSGWITVMSQTGAVGFMLTILIWFKAWTPKKRLQKDKFIILTYAGLAFLTLHSIFEGYMVQAGWYLCLVIWMVQGVMVEYNRYYKVLEADPVM